MPSLSLLVEALETLFLWLIAGLGMQNSSGNGLFVIFGAL